jgi:hypothetical protein
MSQQRMAGDNEFQSKMRQAASGPGGQEHKTKPASLMGAGAWDTQVQRESHSLIMLLCLVPVVLRTSLPMPTSVSQPLKQW